MKPPTEKPKLAKLAFKPRRMWCMRSRRYYAACGKKSFFSAEEKNLVCRGLLLPDDPASVAALADLIAQNRSIYPKGARFDYFRIEALHTLSVLGFKTGGRKP